MPDGLIIDDDGTLIGIEEVKKPDSSGMFVPAGTFGPGGAYGTGMGAGGNLGPGGGFGPGERYDRSVPRHWLRRRISVGRLCPSVKSARASGRNLLTVIRKTGMNRVLPRPFLHGAST